MSGEPVPAAEAFLKGLAPQTIGRPLYVFGVVESTNDTARALAEQGATEGTVVLAGEQRAGRGRLGRAWASPPGGLWLSVVLRPRRPPHEWSRFAFATSVAVASALERTLAVPVRVKWPNDLMLSGRKLGGVLVEAAGAVAIVGIGLNANVRLSALPPSLRAVATSLEEWLGHAVDLVSVTQEILRQLDVAYRLALEAPEEVMAQWRGRSITLGRRVQVRGVTTAFEGVAETIDEDGALLVRTASGLQRVVASDVSVRATEAGR